MTCIFSSTKRLLFFYICIFVVLCISIHAVADDSVTPPPPLPFSQEIQENFFPVLSVTETESPFETLSPPRFHVILVITSSDQRQAHDTLLQGFKNVVREDPNIRYVVEHIDSVEMQINSEIYLPRLYDLLQSRYTTHPDLIVAIGESAYQFMIQYHDDLFPNTPLLSSTLSVPETNAIPGFVTGYARYPTIAQTVDLAQKINPQISKIYVLAPQSLEGTRFIEEIETIAPHIEHIIAPHNQSPQELIAAIQSLGTDAAVILDDYHFSAEAGNRYSIGEILPYIAEQISVPIYTVTDRYNEDGVLGGYQVPLFTTGEKIGTTSLSILSSNFASIVPIGIEMGIPVMIFERLRAFDISESVLPFGTRFVGKPDSRSDSSDQEFPLFVLFIITLFALIIILLVWGERLRYANKTALREQNLQNDIVSHLAFGFYVRDVQDDMRYVLFNPKMEEFTGEERKDVLGRTDPVLGSPVEEEELCIKTQSVVTAEMALTHTEKMRILQYIIHPTVRDNTVIHIRGHVIDITERRMWELELYEHLELFQAYFEKNLYALAIIRTKEDENGVLSDFCFVDINSGLEELFNVHSDDVLGKSGRDVFSTSDATGDKYLWFMELFKAIAQTRTFRFEKMKLGESYVSGNLFKFGENEKYIGFICADTTSIVKFREEDNVVSQHIQHTMYEIIQIREEIMTSVHHIRELISHEEEAMFGEMVTQQASIIEDLLLQIDRDVVQSEKIQDFLEKHHGLVNADESW